MQGRGYLSSTRETKRKMRMVSSHKAIPSSPFLTDEGRRGRPLTCQWQKSGCESAGRARRSGVPGKIGNTFQRLDGAGEFAGGGVGGRGGPTAV